MAEKVKIGIEIHQQLNTEKLFCGCPSLLRNDAPDIIVRRKLRPSAGELGKIDRAALHEFGLERTFTYEAYSETTCLVELDEEPPHRMNLEALEVALQVAHAVGARPIDEIQVMRKAIIDGSCVSGFQRTALAAVDGKLKLKGGKTIGIPTIGIEEDAARIMGSQGRDAVYRLDRAGIPLIEIATTPDISSPDEAREAAEKIGMLLRCTGRAMRGIGTIRQDLNVSIDGGARTEIKGVQWLNLIPLFVENEIKRQESLREIFKKGGIKIGGKKDATGVFGKTKCKIISDRLVANGGVVLSLVIHGSAGLFKRELHPGKRFGREVAEYAKARSGVGGFFHTDELPAYGITPGEVEALRTRMGAHEGDLIILVCEKPALAEKAMAAIIERLDNKMGEETRRANEDGSTSYMRPLPGAGRLYPETDSPQISLKKNFPGPIPEIETPEQKLSRLEKLGLNLELAKSVFLSERADVFDVAIGLGVPATLAATTLEQTIPYLRRKGAKVDALSDEKLVAVFGLLSKNRMAKEAIPDILEKLCSEARLEELVAATKMASEEEVESIISQLVSEKMDYVKSQKERAVGGLMGPAMERLKGRADGKVISAILKKKVAETLSS